MTGFIILTLALAVTLAFGLYRKRTDGRARPVAAQPQEPRLDAEAIGGEFGATATLLQFSSTACAPCRATRVLLSAITADQPDLAHVEVDAETRLDLVEDLDITRTPTVLILDNTGTIRHRIVGAPRRPDLLRALDTISGARAA